MCPVFQVMCILTIFTIAGSGASAEVLTDLSTTPLNVGFANDLGMEGFWRKILEPLDGMRVQEHTQLCADAERLAAELPETGGAARELLYEAVEHVRAANEAVLSQAVSISEVARKKLAHQPGFTSIFARAIRGVVGEDYADRVATNICARQANPLPVLEAAVEGLKVVLEHSRKVSSGLLNEMRRLKADDQVRTREGNEPLTPPEAIEMMQQLADAARETQGAFLSLTVASVHSAATPAADVARDEPLWGVGQATDNIINL